MLWVRVAVVVVAFFGFIAFTRGIEHEMDSQAPPDPAQTSAPPAETYTQPETWAAEPEPIPYDAP